MNGKTRGLILLLASIALFLGSVAMCLALLGRTTAVAPSGGDNKSGGGTSVRVETDAQTGQSIEMDVPDASGHEESTTSCLLARMATAPARIRS